MAYVEARQTFGDRSRLWKPVGIVDPEASKAKRRDNVVAFVSDAPSVNALNGYNRTFFNHAILKARKNESPVAREARIEREKIKVMTCKEKQKADRAARDAEQKRCQEKLLQLQQEAADKERGVGTLKEQIKVLCAKHGADYQDMIGRSRAHRFVNLRHLIIAMLVADNPNVPLTKIGKEFGGRDHSTINSALKVSGVWEPRAQLRDKKGRSKASTEKTGIPGIARLQSGMFRARAYSQGICYECGCYEHLEDAKAAQALQVLALASGKELATPAIRRLIRNGVTA